MLCENCLHKEVCNDEGYYSEALVNCANHIATGCSWIEDAQGIYRCPVCNHTEGKERNFCSDCGSKFII